ncbi:MAG TPA: FRG domain-containing protein [Labilithrix sp.]|nr:FRG domain-containing protein [Labilithrix sp.]
MIARSTSRRKKSAAPKATTKAKPKPKAPKSPVIRVECATWADVQRALDTARRDLGLVNEEPWFRGVNRGACSLSPSLMWRTTALSDDELDDLELDLFFEFQARARELHERGLSDWDYLFFMRHHGVPTRIMDWTDACGVALRGVGIRWYENVLRRLSCKTRSVFSLPIRSR